MSMKTLEFSNVVVSEEIQRNMVVNKFVLAGLIPILDPVISRLATLNPLWTFVIIGTAYSGGVKASNFKVTLDNEALGHIGISYMGAKGNVICISNDRIGKTKTRSNSYRTSDANKAVLMAKKMFGRMSTTERIKKAIDAARDVVTQGSYNKERERRDFTNTFHTELIKWAKDKGQPLFMEYLNTLMPVPQAKTVTHALEKLAIVNIEMKTIERVQEEFGNDKTALVVKDAGKYLVKIGDTVELYDDNTLPVDMRMKIGMLKLIEDGQYLTDMGCRVTSEIFVLLVDDLTNVSKP